MRFGFDAVSAFYECVSEHVIEVQVRVQNAANLEMLALDVIGKSGLFAGVAYAGVYQDGVAGIVA